MNTASGSVMAPSRRNAMTTQTLRRSREPVLFLRRVSVSGPITALAAASPKRKVTIVGRPLRWTQGITITIRAFSRRFYPKRLTSVDTHIDTPTVESTMQGDSQLVRSS